MNNYINPAGKYQIIHFIQKNLHIKMYIKFLLSTLYAQSLFAQNQTHTIPDSSNRTHDTLHVTFAINDEYDAKNLMLQLMSIILNIIICKSNI